MSATGYMARRQRLGRWLNQDPDPCSVDEIVKWTGLYRYCATPRSTCLTDLLLLCAKGEATMLARLGPPVYFGPEGAPA